MSYRTFRRLVGETSLERKVRALLGGALLLLVCLGFFLAACQKDHLESGIQGNRRQRNAPGFHEEKEDLKGRG